MFKKAAWFTESQEILRRPAETSEHTTIFRGPTNNAYLWFASGAYSKKFLIAGAVTRGRKPIGNRLLNWFSSAGAPTGRGSETGARTLYVGRRLFNGDPERRKADFILKEALERPAVGFLDTRVQVLAGHILNSLIEDNTSPRHITLGVVKGPDTLPELEVVHRNFELSDRMNQGQLTSTRNDHMLFELGVTTLQIMMLDALDYSEGARFARTTLAPLG